MTDHINAVLARTIAALSTLLLVVATTFAHGQSFPTTAGPVSDNTPSAPWRNASGTCDTVSTTDTWSSLVWVPSPMPVPSTGDTTFLGCRSSKGSVAEAAEADATGLTIGESYSISFDYTTWDTSSSTYPCAEYFKLSIAGVTKTVNSGPLCNSGWATDTITFTATATTHTLRFEGMAGDSSYGWHLLSVDTTAIVIAKCDPGAVGTYPDCDNDGVNTPTDPDDDNPCVPSPYALTSNLPTGSTTADCDADGTVDTSDPDNGNPCIPSPYANAGALPAGSTATDCDADGTVDTADPANGNPCVPSPYASVADLPVGSTATDCDADGTPDTSDPENGNPCIPSSYASVGALPAGSTATDCDADGTVDTADPDSGNPCVPSPYASIGALPVGSTATDCDADGTPDTSDPANGNPCVPAPYASIGALPVGSTATDCDADGTLDTSDPANGNPCVPAPYASLADLPSGSTATDCDGDGTLDTSDPDSGNPCVPSPYASVADLPAGSTATDCDGDGITDGSDTDNGNPCVPAPYASVADLPSGSTATDCDADGTDNSSDPASGNPCVPAPYASLADLPTGSTATDCDGDGIADTSDPENGNPCVPAPYASVADLPAGSTATDCDGDGVTDGTDADYGNPCVPAPYASAADLPTGSTATDCDGDGVLSADDADDGQSCVPAVYSATSQMPAGGSAEDCDGDGVANATDADPADPCNPVMCEDAAIMASSTVQSQAALRAQDSMHDTIGSRMSPTGLLSDDFQQSSPAGTLNFDTQTGDSDHWVTAGISYVEVSGAGSGEGAFIYSNEGFDLRRTDEHLFGVHFGFEYGKWDFETETDVEKAGLSAGIYGVQHVGDAGLLSGTLAYTYFQNRLENLLSQEAEHRSDRLLGGLRLRGAVTENERFTFVPYVDAQIAHERISGYSYSDGGASFSGGSSTVGDLGFGIDVILPPEEDRGQVYMGLELNQSFGEDDMTLSDGTTVVPHKGPTAAASLGYITDFGEDTRGSIEVSIAEIGDGQTQEIRSDGYWERDF